MGISSPVKRMTRNKRQEKSGYGRYYRGIGDGNGWSKPSQNFRCPTAGYQQVPPCEDGYADSELGKIVAPQEGAMNSDFCPPDWP